MNFLVIGYAGGRDANGIKQLVGSGKAGGHVRVLCGVFALCLTDFRLVCPESGVIEFSEVQVVGAAAAQPRLQNVRRGSVHKSERKRGKKHTVEGFRIGGAENVGNVQTAHFGLCADFAHEGGLAAAGAALDDIKLFQLVKEGIVVGKKALRRAGAKEKG